MHGAVGVRVSKDRYIQTFGSPLTDQHAEDPDLRAARVDNYRNRARSRLPLFRNDLADIAAAVH